MIRLGLVGGFPSEETMAGLYQPDRIGCIVLVLVLGSLRETCFYELAGFLLDGWDGWI